jgi:hypothetical protein
MPEGAMTGRYAGYLTVILIIAIFAMMFLFIHARAQSVGGQSGITNSRVVGGGGGGGGGGGCVGAADMSDGCAIAIFGH